MKYIKQFKQLRIKDIPLVGGKNASLGEMISQLTPKGILIPDGFAITADAYWYYLKYNKLHDEIKKIMDQVTNPNDTDAVHQAGKKVRDLLKNGTMPNDLKEEIIESYHVLIKRI